MLLVVLENHSFSQIDGQSPYLNAVARRCGLATNYTAVAHPSLPNYLALTSGSTHGISDDCTGCTVTAPSVFGQLKGDWRSYLQSIPSVGYAGPFSGDYAKKHNPAAYYTLLTAAYARRAVPLDRLRSDLARDTLSRFSFVVPNLCDDEHSCPVSRGEGWLRTWLPRIFASRAFVRGQTALFITYDEGTADNRVYTVVAAPSVRAGTRVSARFDHYSLLRTVEQLLGLPCLGNACSAPSMARAFRLEP